MLGDAFSYIILCLHQVGFLEPVRLKEEVSGSRAVASWAWVPASRSLSLTAVLWDSALQQQADSAVLAGLGWDCQARLVVAANISLTGVTSTTVSSG